MDVADPRALRDVLRRHGVRAVTSLGQRFLVQQEVARRMAATARDARERGYLSVFTQSFAKPRIVRRVPARAFRPAPRVDSAVVALRTWPRPAFAPLAQEPFLRLVSDAFRHRRKQLRSALGHEAGLDRP